MSRRRFIATTAAGLGLAIGGPVLLSGFRSSAEESTDLLVVPLGSSDRVLVAGRRQRIAFGVVANQGKVPLNDQDRLEVVVRRDGTEIDRSTVDGHVVNHDHVEGTAEDHQHSALQRYYPLHTTLPEPGIYDLEVAVGTKLVSTPIQAFDQSQALVALTGDPFTTPSTPTFSNPNGIDKVCTRFEPCPFHELDALDIMKANRPLALLVATPALCQTAYCGPVVDTLMEVMADLDDSNPLAAVHVEVYANPEEVEGDYTDPDIRLAPAVEALGLTFEPCLYLVDADGILFERLDNVFDKRELVEAVEALTTG